MEKLKILVVDDESRMRKLVRDFLVKQNFEVLEAADGEEALDKFYADKEIALIILDVMMPKMNGWDVCKEIRETSKVPIIMLTAKGEESDELLGFDIGADEYISKPFSPKILVARVEAILRRTGKKGESRRRCLEENARRRDRTYKSRISENANGFEQHKSRYGKNSKGNRRHFRKTEKVKD